MKSLPWEEGVSGAQKLYDVSIALIHNGFSQYLSVGSVICGGIYGASPHESEAEAVPFFLIDKQGSFAPRVEGMGVSSLII